MTRQPPQHGLGAVLRVGNRVGIVVAVALDGSWGANYFRCIRCDHEGGEAQNVNPLTALEPGYTYLMTDGDSNTFLAVENVDVIEPTDRMRVGVVQRAAPPDASPPTEKQIRYLEMIDRLHKVEGNPPEVVRLQSELQVRSLYAVLDVIGRLVHKGLVIRDRGESGEVVSLTPAGSRWVPTAP
jgi:hypothetical protein